MTVVYGIPPEKWDALNERLQRTNFENGARRPLGWKYQAFTLKRAADHLYRITSEAQDRSLKRTIEGMEALRLEGKTSESRVMEGQEAEDFYDSTMMPSYILLMGYAIENLLKSILLLRRPGYVTPQGELQGVRTHDLVVLYERCDMTATEEERTLLHRFTKSIKWQGKYPIPLKSSEMWPQKQPDGSWKGTGGISGAEMQRMKESIDSLFDKLWEEIERIDPSRDHAAASDNAISEE